MAVHSIFRGGNNTPGSGSGSGAPPIKSIITWLAIAIVAVVVLSFFIATLSYALLEEPIIRWARGLERRPIPNNPTLSPAAG